MLDAPATSPTNDGSSPSIATLDSTAPISSSSLAADAEMTNGDGYPTLEGPVSAPPPVVEEKLTLHMKWSGKAYELVLSSSDLCVSSSFRRPFVRPPPLSC